MTIKASVLIGTAVLGLALFVVAGPSGERRGGVLINPDPPQAPIWGLKWETGTPPEPAEAPEPAGRVDAAPLADDPGAAGEQPAGDAGIWATPAEFSAED